ncbi:MAG: hypothetical protein KA296_00290 [Marinobacter sp.]|nr:hypothetical protein [Marinobacter sp.]
MKFIFQSAEEGPSEQTHGAQPWGGVDPIVASAQSINEGGGTAHTLR